MRHEGEVCGRNLLLLTDRKALVERFGFILLSVDRDFELLVHDWLLMHAVRVQGMASSDST